MYIHVYFRRPPSQTTPKNPGPKSFWRKEKSHIILNWKSLRSWDQVARMLWLCFPRNHTLVHQQQPATIYWLPSIAKELKWKHHLVIETLQSFVVKHAVEWKKDTEERDRDQETVKRVLRLMLPANPVPWKTNPKKIKKKKQSFTMFPFKQERRQSSRKFTSKEIISIYCVCQLPAINNVPMIQRSNCKRRFHGKHGIKTQEDAWLLGKKWLCSPECFSGKMILEVDLK